MGDDPVPASSTLTITRLDGFDPVQGFGVVEAPGSKLSLPWYFHARDGVWQVAVANEGHDPVTVMVTKEHGRTLRGTYTLPWLPVPEAERILRAALEDLWMSP